MKLIIDIDENVFTRLFDNGTEDYGIGNDDVFTIAKSIRNGTPLPKGHVTEFADRCRECGKGFIRKQDIIDFYNTQFPDLDDGVHWSRNDIIQNLDSIHPSDTGRCKDCKYFEYDSVAKVDGIPLIVAHEICSKWGDGCKTNENGYCYMFEPQESEE